MDYTHTTEADRELADRQDLTDAQGRLYQLELMHYRHERDGAEDACAQCMNEIERLRSQVAGLSDRVAQRDQAAGVVAAEADGEA